MGVTIGCGVVPAAVTIGWSKTNRTAAMSAPLIGLAAAIASWLGTTAALYDGVLTVATTGQVLPMMVSHNTNSNLATTAQHVRVLLFCFSFVLTAAV